MKKWVVMDAMGVIFKVGDDTNELLVPYAKGLNPRISKKDIVDLYTQASFGKITSKEFWNNVSPGSKYPKIEHDYLNTSLKISLQALELANKLRKSYGLAIFSNDVKEWSIFLRKKFHLDKIFSEAVISGEAGVRKPDKAIFDSLLSKIQTTPDRVVFLDDNPNNILAAVSYGFNGIQIVDKITNPENRSGLMLSTLRNVYEKIVNVLEKKAK